VLALANHSDGGPRVSSSSSSSIRREFEDEDEDEDELLLQNESCSKIWMGGT